MRRSFVSIAIACLFIPYAGASTKFPTVAWDNIQWDFPLQPNIKVIAIGDLHGDFSALINILLGLNLIDSNGVWIGGKIRLVFVGDIPDRGGESRLISNFLMRLEKDAKSKNGEIHVLVGNHEAMVTSGDLRYASDRTIMSFEDFGPGREGLRRGYQDRSIYAEWIRGRNSAIVVGRTLFIHAGLEAWVDGLNFGELNATVRSWLKFNTGFDAKPPSETDWVMRDTGPLWTRVFDPEEPKVNVVKDLPPAILQKTLDRLGVDRVVVGHTRTYDAKVLLQHPVFGSKVVMIDTGISHAYNGSLSALVIEGNSVRDRYFSRESSDVTTRLVNAELAILRDQKAPQIDPCFLK